MGEKSDFYWIACTVDCFFFLGFVDSLFWLIILRGLQGIAAATFSPVALAYVVEMFPVEKKLQP
ncbi:MFS transporter [Bacillus toyonensis]